MGTSASPLYDKFPDRRRRNGLVHTAGECFLGGTAIGSALHSIKAFRSAPVGRRLAGAAHAAIKHAPRFGGSVGALTALMFVFEGAMANARRKEDAWNSVAAGAAAIVLLEAPRGGGIVGATASAIVGVAVGSIYHLPSWIEQQFQSST